MEFKEGLIDQIIDFYMYHESSLRLLFCARKLEMTTCTFKAKYEWAGEHGSHNTAVDFAFLTNVGLGIILMWAWLSPG